MTSRPDDEGKTREDGKWAGFLSSTLPTFRPSLS
jgi:hypothetical protein